ncbi:Sucrase/ferredoxin-like-domain-containing protein [Crucibulum laeve]|uniref:Sucrase/ferredoxin-like-domain-containing protein n=1 Tax=Crucibulum laeve TaxID=68775 RepID=A0A5C3LSS3_9AGAR|nr:Sucrase/ferredoxin-like-domain-containing protein [Crucibulum laeve]
MQSALKRTFQSHSKRVSGVRYLATSTEQPAQTTPKTLYGTVPSHRSYIFLHASEPPTQFPAKFSTAIQRALLLKAMKWGAVVNFSWFGHPPALSGDKVSVTAFSAQGGRLEIPELSLENVDEVEALLRNHAEGPLTKETCDAIHLYVCTHGARDCRCGETGGAVFRALQEEVARRTKEDPNGLVSKIRVGEVGHVGGHQWAANLLIYPHGEWLGKLKPEDVPQVLSAILEKQPKPFIENDTPLLLPHWRGRMGLSKDDQLQLYAAHAN